MNTTGKRPYVRPVMTRREKLGAVTAKTIGSGTPVQ
jgi:hypothetical protein